MSRILLILFAACLALPAHADDDTTLSVAEREMKKGDAFFERKAYLEAAQHYDVARTLAPERPGPYLWLGLSYERAGHCQDATKHLETYLRLKREDPRPEAQQAIDRCRQTNQIFSNVPPPRKRTYGWVAGVVVPIAATGLALGFGLGFGLNSGGGSTVNMNNNTGGTAVDAVVGRP